MNKKTVLSLRTRLVGCLLLFGASFLSAQTNAPEPGPGSSSQAEKQGGSLVKPAAPSVHESQLMTMDYVLDDLLSLTNSVKKGNLFLTQYKGKLNLQLSEGMLFDEETRLLSVEGESILEAIGEVVNTVPGVYMVVVAEGVAPVDANPQRPWQGSGLSAEAAATAHYLKVNTGVDHDRLEVVSRIQTGKRGARKAQSPSRNVVIWFMPEPLSAEAPGMGMTE